MYFGANLNKTLVAFSLVLQNINVHRKLKKIVSLQSKRTFRFCGAFFLHTKQHIIRATSKCKNYKKTEKSKARKTA